MTTFTTCYHCHEPVPTWMFSCPKCGHDAHTARINCHCVKCRPARVLSRPEAEPQPRADPKITPPSDHTCPF